MPTSEDRDLARLEELKEYLAEHPGTMTDYIREHLEAARYYHLGAMPEEYQLTLNLVEQALPDVHDHEVKSRLEEFLESQKAQEHHATSSPSA